MVLICQYFTSIGGYNFIQNSIQLPYVIAIGVYHMNNDTFLNTMGSRITQRRKELHLTQEQLAEKMGVSLQTISCIELGKKAIRPENLANLCFYLNVTSDYILYGKRSESQMNELITKLSTLSQREYESIYNLIEILSEKK